VNFELLCIGKRPEAMLKELLFHALEQILGQVLSESILSCKSFKISVSWSKKPVAMKRADRKNKE